MGLDHPLAGARGTSTFPMGLFDFSVLDLCLIATLSRSLSGEIVHLILNSILLRSLFSYSLFNLRQFRGHQTTPSVMYYCEQAHISRISVASSYRHLHCKLILSTWGRHVLWEGSLSELHLRRRDNSGCEDNKPPKKVAPVKSPGPASEIMSQVLLCWSKFPHGLC